MASGNAQRCRLFSLISSFSFVLIVSFFFFVPTLPLPATLAFTEFFFVCFFVPLVRPLRALPSFGFVTEFCHRYSQLSPVPSFLSVKVSRNVTEFLPSFLFISTWSSIGCYRVFLLSFSLFVWLPSFYLVYQADNRVLPKLHYLVFFTEFLRPIFSKGALYEGSYRVWTEFFFCKLVFNRVLT